MYKHEKHNCITVFAGKSPQIISIRVKRRQSNADNIKVEFKRERL
jgi:hypothetical protein